MKQKNSEVNDLQSEVGKWSLENAGHLVFDKRLGCLHEETQEFGMKMVEANKQTFKYSGRLKKRMDTFVLKFKL